MERAIRAIEDSLKIWHVFDDFGEGVQMNLLENDSLLFELVSQPYNVLRCRVCKVLVFNTNRSTAWQCFGRRDFGDLNQMSDEVRLLRTQLTLSGSCLRSASATAF